MSTKTSPVGLHRVIEPQGVLPQAAQRLDNTPRALGDEIRIDVAVLNLDSASYHQLAEVNADSDPQLFAHGMRQAVLGIVETRGKMQNPVTGSGGMLIGTVAEIGPEASTSLKVGDKVATLVSLSLTPLHITDELSSWDGTSEQVPAAGSAILFGKTIVEKLPEDLDENLALMLMDVCGAPALVKRCLQQHTNSSETPAKVAVLGGSGKSGALSISVARDLGADVVAVVPSPQDAKLLADTMACPTVVADAQDPVAVSTAVAESLGSPADLTVVCVNVAGCEHGAIMCTADGGTIIFFSMATSFSTAALGAEGLAADVTMLVGNGYVPGHARLTFDQYRKDPQLAQHFDRLNAE